MRKDDFDCMTMFRNATASACNEDTSLYENVSGSSVTTFFSETLGCNHLPLLSLLKEIPFLITAPEPMSWLSTAQGANSLHLVVLVFLMRLQ